MIHFSTLVFLSLLDLFNPVYLPGKFGITMNQNEILTIIEHYSRQSTTTDGSIKVTRVPDYKTVFIEQTGANGRSVIMNPI
jgi:hypothetical protein